MLAVACSSPTPTKETAPTESSSKPATPSLPHLEVAPDEKIRGWVDVLTASTPKLADPARLVAEGWAASCVAGAPITSVTLLVDGKPMGETRTFSARPDVAAVFNRPDFEKSGWKIDLPLRKLPPGKHPVTVRAMNANKDMLILPGASLTVE